ncbi:hypothetical protein TIFTF001_035192 [Ficus carica]|uniref:Uncharacterized protein n=1 Tax=Ficus carica TaxID=3494 RepID=A0AA88E179_FICCA|nr:hypothetical protein TIFTF001_035169 [Ficus carica]GMN66121.1 hypothetical protein TIFTF001_035192 [Ficus carica]
MPMQLKLVYPPKHSEFDPIESFEYSSPRRTSINRGLAHLFSINISSNHNLTTHIPRSPDRDKAIDEQASWDIQGLDNPTPTGSQNTRRPQRRRGARAQHKPTQTEILAWNIQSLTNTVRVLVDIFRESQNIQLHQAQEEAAKSTPTRQPMSAGRPQKDDRQRYGLEQVGAVDPPFTLMIMVTPYLTRFKMPSVAPYDSSTDAD